MNKIGVITAVFVVLFLVLLLFSTFHGKRYRVEVCMTYAGHLRCRTVSAKSEQAALRSGAENACAEIASGVTDSIRCEQSDPQSVKWLERPGQ